MQSFSPEVLFLSWCFGADPKEIKLKNIFKLAGSECISLIVSIAPEVDNFLAIVNNLKLFLTFKFSNPNV